LRKVPCNYVFREFLGVNTEDRTIGLLPFFHIYGLTAVQFGSMYDGAELVTIPRFDPEIFLKTLHEKKVREMCRV